MMKLKLYTNKSGIKLFNANLKFDAWIKESIQYESTLKKKDDSNILIVVEPKYVKQLSREMFEIEPHMIIIKEEEDTMINKFSKLKHEIELLNLKHKQELESIKFYQNKEIEELKNKCTHKYEDEVSAKGITVVDSKLVACEICDKLFD